ncbi:hypothetical protein KUM42_04195 [Modestobacter sp. L9-4]|uniref:hypothetical protein n=1 Tax=Modestobacter sp. L9-4 TaxID=2851567 RepID=UPI001C767876|nr:hypothetical protein [Modestobacter sp. L9-4]QXG76761.1 hypothetical protein KUM42_04195 [Modestobacter sp. L9-4]
MANGPVRPPWLGNWGVQLLGVGLSLYNAVQLVRHLVDGEYGSAFLSFAYVVVFGYVALESWRTRQELAAKRAADGPAPIDPPAGPDRPAPTDGPAPTD